MLVAVFIFRTVMNVYCKILDDQPDLNFLGYEQTIKDFMEKNQ